MLAPPAATPMPTISASSAIAVHDLSPRSAGTQKDPWVAAGLSGLAPPTLAYFGAADRNWTLVMLTPLGWGLGQAYSGDCNHAMGVSLGGYVAVLGGIAVGFLIDEQVPLGDSGPGSVFMGPTFTVAGGLAAIALYDGWAAWDAYHTAVRVNRERLSKMLPPGGPAGQKCALDR